ncbi:MAG TPA: hypothetical protein VEH04_02330 [Verrucomicrobiae bacterium]|nr:hypothetical protein [Verrucomicrobiae bacterium]
MQFIKKNYEKVLLAVVLLGLVAAAGFLLLKVASEKQKQEERRNRIFNRPVKELPEIELGHTEELLKRAEATIVLNFSDNLHKIFNPVRWQKTQDGRYVKNPPGQSLEKMELTKITPLFFVVRLESVNIAESGTRYGFVIEQQAAARPAMRGPRPYYASKGEKREYGENKQAFLVKEVTGNPETPDIQLELSDLEQPITVSKEQPYRRVDGYMADLRFPPENRTFTNRRKGDRIVVAGEEYNIVAITENEVVLSAQSNQKKWTIKNSATP